MAKLFTSFMILFIDGYLGAILLKYNGYFDKLYEFQQTPVYLNFTIAQQFTINILNTSLNQCQLICHNNGTCISLQFLQITETLQYCFLYNYIPSRSHLLESDFNFDYQVIYVKNGILIFLNKKSLFICMKYSINLLIVIILIALFYEEIRF